MQLVSVRLRLATRPRHMSICFVLRSCISHERKRPRYAIIIEMGSGNMKPWDEFFNMKRVLITGSNGFTGRHLANFLTRDDSLELHLADHAERESDPRFHLCDLSVTQAAAKLIKTTLPDAIYHLVGSYTNNYETDYTSNVVTTKNILDAVLASGNKTRVLLVGSSAEYGFPLKDDVAVSEDHPCKPVSVYGLAKLFQTELMEVYVRLYGMDIVAVRPFNLLGKGMSSSLFVGKMEQEIARYRRGEIKTISTGDLSVERDYIDIGEAIKYYRLVLEKGKTGEVYNVGSGKSISLRDIVKRMLELSGLSMDIVREGAHKVAGKIVVPKLYADINKLQKLSNS